MRDEEYVDNLIQRARNAGVSALVITLDLQILGQRHKDLKNKLSAPPKLTPRMIWDYGTKWRWTLGIATSGKYTFRNIAGHAKNVTNLSSLNTWTHEQFEPKLDWSMVAKLKEKWGGKVILKGILDVEDAKKAVEIGADAIVVSNHGGRQLDGAISSIRALPAIVEAVGCKTEVWLDSGIRSGQDILKALAMGAKGTMIGRAYLHGLGAMGEAGVAKTLEVLQRELDISMALCGRRDVTTLDRDILLVPEGFEGVWQ